MDKVEPNDSLDEAVDFLKDGMDPDLVARLLAIPGNAAVAGRCAASG